MASPIPGRLPLRGSDGWHLIALAPVHGAIVGEFVELADGPLDLADYLRTIHVLHFGAGSSATS